MNRRRSWRDLTAPQRVTLVTMATIQLSLAASAWADLAARPTDQVVGSKARWAVIIAVNFIGPLAYFRWGRRPAA